MQHQPGIPRHIAIIMDGNGRWANRRGLSRNMGHRQGVKAVEAITKHCLQIGVEYLTLYAFSTENWSRPQNEIDAIMNLLREYLAQCERQGSDEVCTRFIGDRSPLDADISSKMAGLESASANNTGLHLNIAVNYGGRDEIVHAARRLACLAAEGKLDPKDIDNQIFAGHLYTEGQPDPDLIIRPSGELRLSNFMLWQCAYSEFVFMDILWPDFTPNHLDSAIAQFAQRDRRFGGI